MNPHDFSLDFESSASAVPPLGHFRWRKPPVVWVLRVHTLFVAHFRECHLANWYSPFLPFKLTPVSQSVGFEPALDYWWSD